MPLASLAATQFSSSEVSKTSRALIVRSGHEGAVASTVRAVTDGPSPVVLPAASRASTTTV